MKASLFCSLVRSMIRRQQKRLGQRNMRMRPHLMRSTLGADAQLIDALRLALDTAGAHPALFANNGVDRE
jgi:hypothetical protein